MKKDDNLGGLSKALQLPTRGKRSNVSSKEEGLCDHSDFREPKRGKVGDGDVVGTILLVGWRATLAESNEDLKLDLPRAWEPLDRS